MTHPLQPGKQGLYDPQYEHDACGVGFVVDLKGRKSHDIVAKAIRHPRQPGASRRLRLREQHRRRRRHPHADAASLPRRECDSRSASRFPARRLRRRHASSCRPIRDRAARLRADCSRRSSAKKDRRPRLARRADRQLADRPDGAGHRAGHAADLHRTQDEASLAHGPDGLAFERKLYVIRRRVENAVKDRTFAQRGMFYVPSLSCKTLIYKGMLHAPTSSPQYFPDLHDPDMESALAMVHSRFSTNTFPNWARAHPYRYLAHNGEINTLRGNVNWMLARQNMFASHAVRRRHQEDCCRSSTRPAATRRMFDNALELLVLTGRSLPHAVMMMIPEPWTGDRAMSAGEEGVLRVSLLPDGAVGRARLDRLHRRHPHRRRPRPQRPAPVALLRHQGRPGHHGVRGRRARHAAGERAAQGPAAAGPHVPGRHWSRAASSPTRS